MSDQPKRILSFDGGGIRGIFSLQIAARIEQLFREEYGQPNLVLADVYDMFAGTSTGAIIATFLAWGGPVADADALFTTRVKQLFAHQQPYLPWRLLKSKYRAEVIADFFRGHFVEDDGRPALLGSAKLKKLLLVVMRNATTGAPWPISSNLRAMYNDRSLANCNLDIPLWQLLRASTAAPTFFPPEQITLGGDSFLFVDGAVTPFNNPALLAALMATLPAYRLEWPTGRDALHVMSIGTGGHRSHLNKRMASKTYVWDALRFVIPALLDDASINQDMMCRVLGDCLHGAPLDSELGSLETPALLAPAEQKFSYVRYNCMMDSKDVGDPLTPTELQIDNLRAVERLQAIGRDYAAREVKREHLFGL
jgi:patatin-like phospholipase/acyl hydrolase